MAEKRAFANWVLLILLFVIAGAAVAMPVCNVDSTDLYKCLPAVKSSTPPTPACCSVVKRVNIPCLCGLKSNLRNLGISPAAVFALPKKCGLKTKVPCAA